MKSKVFNSTLLLIFTLFMTPLTAFADIEEGGLGGLIPSDSNQNCKAKDFFIPYPKEQNEAVTLPNGSLVWRKMMFNPKCASAQWAYYAKSGANVFYRQQYGEYVTYTPMPPDEAYAQETTFNDMNNLYEHFLWQRTPFQKHVFRTWGVPLNTTWCGEDNKASCRSDMKYEGGHGVDNAGTKGEWRYLGYSSTGASMPNTYYPPARAVLQEPGAYPFMDTPWNVAASDFRKPNATDYDTGDRGKRLKQSAIKRLKEQDPTFDKSVDYYMNAMSLRNDPTNDAAVFWGLNGDANTSTINGYNVIVSPVPPPEVRNVTMKRLSVMYEGKEIAWAQRNDDEAKWTSSGAMPQVEAGEPVTIKATLKNTSSVTTTVKKVCSNIVVTVDGDQYKGKLVSTDGAMKPNLEYTVAYEVSFPAGAKSFIIKSIICDDYLATGDNQFDEDDQLQINGKIAGERSGDLIATSIELIDGTTGKAVQYPLPNKSYKLRYTVKYEGDDMKKNIYRLIIGHNESIYKMTDKAPVLLSDYGTDYVYKKGYQMPGIPDLELTGDDTFTFETKPMTLETPYVEACMKIQHNAGDKVMDQINTNRENDEICKAFVMPVDIAVTNLTFNPTHMTGDGSGFQSTQVCYEVYYSVPQEITEPVQTYVNMVTFDGSSWREVTLYPNKTNSKATGGEEAFCMRYDKVDSRPMSSIPITVIANPAYRQTVFETGPYTNNAMTKPWTIKTGGGGTSTIPGGSGDGKACPLNKKQTATTFEHEYKWKLEEVDQLWPGGDKYPEEKDTKRKSKDISQKVEHTETYQISKVEIKHKGTVENTATPEWETVYDGRNTKRPTAIKAGYGMELRVTVEYRMNKYVSLPLPETDPNKTWQKCKDLRFKSGGRCTFEELQIQPTAELPAIVPITDMYMDVMSNGQSYFKANALNANQMGGLKLESSREFRDGNDHVVQQVYIIKDRVSPNGTGETVEKIYIGEDTKDGIYQLSFTTPSIDAAGPDNLCDAVIIDFEVRGSMYDDLHSHIIQ